MTNLKVFQDKQALLKSLPALTASDFIIYDTSDQDETKPFVLVSFSFYNEKEGSYTYQIRTETSLGNFITAVAKSSGSSSNTGFYMYDVRTFYYDLPSHQWVLDVVNTRSGSAKSTVGLKGSLNTIVYATRDVYYSSSTMRPKDSRLLLSGRFRNDTPFDEFFNQSHLDQLGYETGDDLLRVKYADNNHLLFVIKGSTSPLKAIYSSTYYYNLTISGTIKGLQCKDGVYTEVSSLQHVASETLSFDDYVLYSTLDITFQDRLMRVKDHYITGTRDEIVSVSPNTIQIKEPFHFDVQTNPVGLEVEIIPELPETYDIIRDEVIQFRAGNSYVYEHWFETVDLVGEWARRPLPPKKTVANFHDGNAYRIVYQYKENEYKMLTFNMEDDCKVYWGNTVYGEWFFSDRTKASNFTLYTLTPNGIEAGVPVTWQTSSVLYLNSSATRAYKREVGCIFFSNVTIYDTDQTNVLVESSTLSELYPYYFHLKSVGFDPDCRIKVGEVWENSLQIDYEKGEGATIQSIEFSGDYKPSYEKVGSYYLTANIVIEQNPDEVFSYPFFINIYDENCLFYPNNLPFPVQDGTKEAIIYKSNNDVYLMTYTATSHIHLYQYSATSLRFFDAHPDKGYGATTGESLYLLENQKWVYQPGKQQFPYQCPRTNPSCDILYSTVNVYSTQSALEENLVRLADPKLLSEDYHVDMRYYKIPFKLPPVTDLLNKYSTIHYFITYQASFATLCVLVPSVGEDFHLKVTGSSSSSYALAPSVKSNIHYYNYDGTTEDWTFRTSFSNETSFSSTYLANLASSFKMNGSSSSTYLSINERIAYTTIPVYIQRSKDTLYEPTLIRDPDNKLVADENSIAPTVIDILTGQEEPYTVDTKFTFDLACEFEDIEGNFITKTEWENKQLKYPVGINPVRARVRDNRELWSEWFEKTITIEHPKMSANAVLGVHDLPLQANGEAYDHYLIFKYHATNALAYRCWGFVLKEGVESFKVASYNNSLYFSDYANKIFEKVDWYTGYDSTTGWGNRTALNLGYTNYNGGVLDGLASNIYYSTFPIYGNNTFTELLAHPLTSVLPLPFKIALTSTHEDVWTNEDVTIRYEIETLNQAHKEIKYRVNNGEYLPLTELIGRLTFNQSGIYTVEVVAVNQDDVATTATISFKIDKDAPTVSVVDQGTQLAFTITDQHSGLNTAHYRLATIDGVEQNNGWTKITPTGSIKKPIYGGRYVYEFKLIDNLNNTAILEHVFDLAKIPIEQIVVEPTSLRMKHEDSQKLTLSYLPTNHNEEIKSVTYENLTPDLISLSSSNTITVADPYREGQAQIKITVNHVETFVPIEVYIHRVSYLDTLPNLQDLYWYDEYTDFIIANTGGTTYRLYAFNRKDEEAIFYIKYINNNYRLNWSIADHVTELKYYNQDDKKWKRHSYDGTVMSTYASSTSFRYENPNKCVYFSTVDLYSDETGEVLARPKDTVPPTQLAEILLNLNGYGGEWTPDANLNVVATDTGGGISKILYSFDGGTTEIEIENGGKIEFPKSGNYQVLAAVYNDELAPHKVTLDTPVKIDREAPKVSISKTYYSSTKSHNLVARAEDSMSGVCKIRYRVADGEWVEMTFDNRSIADWGFLNIPHTEYGSYRIEVEAYDAAGNVGHNFIEFEIPRPTPSAIVVNPKSLTLLRNQTAELEVNVVVDGRLEENEIILTSENKKVVTVNGQTITAIGAGETRVAVECRGVIVYVPVVVHLFELSRTKVKINGRFVSFYMTDVETSVKVKENGKWISLVTQDEYPTYEGFNGVKIKINNQWKVLPICE